MHTVKNRLANSLRRPSSDTTTTPHSYLPFSTSATEMCIFGFSLFACICFSNASALFFRKCFKNVWFSPLLTQVWAASRLPICSCEKRMTQEAKINEIMKEIFSAIVRGKSVILFWFCILSLAELRSKQHRWKELSKSQLFFVAKP